MDKAKTSGSYIVTMLIFVLAWFLTLIGLSMAQNWCRDYDIYPFPGASDLLAVPMGNKCNKLFRFVWWVWVLNLIPMITGFSAYLRPKIARVAAAASFAAMSPLNMLIANGFYNVSDFPDLEDDGQTRAKLVLSGFAIMGGLGLLLMLLDQVLVEEPKPETGGLAPKEPATV